MPLKSATTSTTRANPAKGDSRQVSYLLDRMSLASHLQ
jgi:hypothetical protein